MHVHIPSVLREIEDEVRIDLAVDCSVSVLYRIGSVRGNRRPDEIAAGFMPDDDRRIRRLREDESAFPYGRFRRMDMVASRIRAERSA